MAMMPTTPNEVGYRQVGLLIDGIEFVPLDIVRAPFAPPPGTTVEAVYVKAGVDALAVEQLAEENHRLRRAITEAGKSLLRSEPRSEVMASLRKVLG